MTCVLSVTLCRLDAALHLMRLHTISSLDLPLCSLTCVEVLHGPPLRRGFVLRYHGDIPLVVLTGVQ